MRRINVPPPVLQAAAWSQRLWWRVAKPATFGVKAFLTLPDGRFLVVRHAYGDTARWGLPGGGYKPVREMPKQAAAREMWEELRIAMDAAEFTVLDRAKTAAEGKRDTVTIVTAPAPTAHFHLASEIAEARWIRSLDELGGAPVSRWLKAALALTGR